MDIPLDKLQPYPDFGRDLSLSRLAKLRGGWFPAMLGNLFVVHDPISRTYTVIDGNHRFTIAREKGAPDPIPCRVFEHLSKAQQAASYDALNDISVQRTRDIFKVRLAWGDPVAVSINQTVIDAGYQLAFGSPSRGTRSIQCFKALEYVHTAYGQSHLFKTLVFIRSVFADDRRAVRDFSVKAMANILKAYPGRLDETRLQNQLTQAGFSQVLGQAHNRQLEAPYPALTTAFGDAMVGTYNRNLPRTSASYLAPFRGRVPTMEPPTTKPTSRGGKRGAYWNTRIHEDTARPS